jgi:hypothetical protein
MDKNTKIVWLPVEDLIPYEHNAKEHDEVQVKNIAKSIEKYGWQNPVLIDKDNVIIAGHGRVLGAQELGLKDIPCIYADDLTEEQVREYRILDNKLNESSWIDDELDFELAELDLSDFDLELDVQEEIEKEKKEVGEVPFTEELMLTHNYIVLYFDNDFDWEVAQDKFGLKQVRDLIPRKGQPKGIGRVINGKRILEWREN